MNLFFNYNNKSNIDKGLLKPHVRSVQNTADSKVTNQAKAKSTTVVPNMRENNISFAKLAGHGQLVNILTKDIPSDLGELVVRTAYVISPLVGQDNDGFGDSIICWRMANRTSFFLMRAGAEKEEARGRKILY